MMCLWLQIVGHSCILVGSIYYVIVGSGHDNKLCLNEIHTSIQTYIVAHIKIHKLTGHYNFIQLIHSCGRNMSQRSTHTHIRARTTGGFTWFYCVSCFHKNVVKHALSFLLLYPHQFSPPFLTNERKKECGFCLITLLLVFEHHTHTLRLYGIPNEGKRFNSIHISIKLLGLSFNLKQITWELHVHLSMHKNLLLYIFAFERIYLWPEMFMMTNRSSCATKLCSL